MRILNIVVFRTGRGAHGAWQKFERGEMPLFSFYGAFGRELSDTTVNNVWYAEYCKRKGFGNSLVLVAHHNFREC